MGPTKMSTYTAINAPQSSRSPVEKTEDRSHEVSATPMMPPIPPAISSHMILMALKRGLVALVSAFTSLSIISVHCGLAAIAYKGIS